MIWRRRRGHETVASATTPPPPENPPPPPVNLGIGGPLSVIPCPTPHGDVHVLKIGRSNGDSLTVEEYRRVFAAVTGRTLSEDEVAAVRDWFAEEDR